ncbi:MAG: hypothetical protein PUK76_03065 [Treponema sp.]|nr:hypothetical protein [Treponema sp.]
MNNFIEILKMFFLGEVLLFFSLVPHFFIKRMSPKMIFILAIVVSLLWLCFSVYYVVLKTGINGDRPL